MTIAEKIRVQDGGDLLALLPYVVGFQIRESVLVLLLRGSHLLMTARFDHAMFHEPDVVAARVQQMRDQYPDSRVILAAFGDDPTQCHDHLGFLETLIPEADVVESLLTNHERWWTRLCRDATCCPTEGRPLDVASPGAAAAVVAGLMPLADRESLRSMVSGPTPSVVEAHAKQFSAARQRYRRASKRTIRNTVRRLVTSATGDQGEVRESDLIDLAVFTDDIGARDIAWLMMRRDTAEAHQELWQRVVAIAPERHAIAPLCLLGMAGWIGGNGALQNCCVERGMEVNPRYSMLRLLDDISLGAAPPTMWDEMVAAQA